MHTTNDFGGAAGIVREGHCVIASTGAGMSTESGIPDFRGANGIWAKYPPEEYATIDAFVDDPAKVWKLWRDLGEQFAGCKPNPGHIALAELERAGKLTAIITQNVDNLHQDAGSSRVVEYHGNTRRLVCMQCGHAEPYEPGRRTELVPRCICSGLLKPDVVMFGELIPQKAMLQADAYARSADVVIIVGTSAQVYPAAELPFTAKRNNAKIVEINLEETDFTHGVTDVFLQGKAGEILPRLIEMISA